MSEQKSKGAWIGSVCLVILVFQNSLFFLATHQGRVPDKDGHVYFAPTMVVLVELIKAMISLGILSYTLYQRERSSPLITDKYSLLPTSPELQTDEEMDADCDVESNTSSTGSSHGRSLRSTIHGMSTLIFSRSAWKLCIPATLYVVQTNLAVIGAENLDSTSFIIASQLKFATTALCTSVMLKRVIGLKRWMSLGALATGVLLVQLAGQTQKENAATSARSPLIGLTSIVAACFISGFASIYLEKILKDATTNLWATNIQLGTFSLLPAALPLILDAYKNGALHPFANFGMWAWTTVGANVMGGLVVALIMKYADNIQKSLAISASIVLTFAITVVMGKAEAQPMAVGGSTIVIVSIVAYNKFVPTPVVEQEPEEHEEEEGSALQITIDGVTPRT